MWPVSSVEMSASGFYGRSKQKRPRVDSQFNLSGVINSLGSSDTSEALGESVLDDFDLSDEEESINRYDH